MPARKPTTPQPEPVVKTQVCSICDLSWDLHGENPTVEKCVDLLKAELAKRPKWNAQVYGTSIQPAAPFNGNTC